MAGFPYINVVQGDNQLMSSPEGTMFSLMSLEGGSSSGKRKRGLERGEDDHLARLHLRAPRIPKQPPPSPVVSFRILNPSMMQFLFKKHLHRSDVGRVNRIVLPKYEVEEYLPHLVYKEGIWMHMDDMDYYQVWTIKFRFWNNNNSGRIYIFENTKEFVTSHGLGVGDSIEVFKDIMSGSFIIRASNTSGAPGLIHERRLKRSTENDEYILKNQVNIFNKEEPQSAKNTFEQVVQEGSSDVHNNKNLLPQPVVPIVNNNEVPKSAQPAAQPAQDCCGEQEENTLDNIFNECFPTSDDFDDFYALLMEW